jgi:hypothetical protein
MSAEFVQDTLTTSLELKGEHSRQEGGSQVISNQNLYDYSRSNEAQSDHTLSVVPQVSQSDFVRDRQQ